MRQRIQRKRERPTALTSQNRQNEPGSDAQTQTPVSGEVVTGTERLDDAASTSRLNQPREPQRQPLQAPRFGHQISRVQIFPGVPAPAALAPIPAHDEPTPAHEPSGQGSRTGAPVPSTLATSQVGDSDEREADTMASRVVRISTPEKLTLPNTPAQAEHGQPDISRQPVSGDVGAGGMALGTNAAAAVSETLASDGQSLEGQTRAFMEPRFGYNFGQVRIHADGRAAESARSINARAYTLGDHIAFGAGEYAPQTRPGRELLAHELTHVIQQGAGGASADAQPTQFKLQRQPDAPPATLSPADQLKADFEHEVANSGWARAAELLNGFNDVDLPARAAWLAPKDRTAIRENTSENLPRVRGALIVADFHDSTSSGQWETAAIHLNGLDAIGIERQIAQLIHPERANLYIGAVSGMTGPSLLRIIEPIAKTDLDAAYEAELRPPANWAKAVEYLNGFSTEDLKARVAKLSPGERAAMRPVVPEWSARVRGALLDVAFTESLAAGTFDEAARNLNGFDDPGIKEHVAQVPQEQLLPLLEASDRVNGENAIRSDRPILSRILNLSLAGQGWLDTARAMEEAIQRGGAFNKWMDILNPGQLQALMQAAKQVGAVKVAEAVSPRLSQKLSDQQSTSLTYEMDTNGPPGTANLTQTHERQNPKYIDNVVYQVMVGIYLPGYFVFCAGFEKPLVIPWDQVQYSTIPVPSINEITYDNREHAVAEIAATPTAPRGAYAYYRATGGYSAPTIFSWATAPHIMGMLEDAMTRLKQEVQNDLVVQALFIAGGVAADFTAATFAKSGAEAAAPAEGAAARPNAGTSGPQGSVGAMRLPKYEVGPMNAARPGLRVPSAEVGQEAVENSLLIGRDLGPTRRVGVNRQTGEIIDFQETENGSYLFRGVVRRWEELPPAAQNELISAGYTTRSGRIVADVESVKRVARFNNFRRPINANEVQGAPPAEGSSTPGHARSKHQMRNDQLADIMNTPERIFNGVNENGREVDIYCKRVATDPAKPDELTDMAVITEAGNKQSVITAYNRSASTWEGEQSYVEISVRGSNDITYHTPADMTSDFWPEWNWREHNRSQSGP